MKTMLGACGIAVFSCVLPLYAADDVDVPVPSNENSLVQFMADWTDYAQNPSQVGKEKLLAAHTKALEALLYLLYGAAPNTSSLPAEFSTLIRDLGADSFKTREQATAKLRAMGPLVWPVLDKHPSREDPEVLERIKQILADRADSKLTDEDRTRLLTAATALLEREWPQSEMASVVEKYSEALLAVETCAYHWDRRPLSPMLASLRYSGKSEHHELFCDFVRRGRDGVAPTAVSIMGQGLTGRGVARDRWPVPENRNYVPVITEVLKDRPTEAVATSLLNLLRHRTDSFPPRCWMGDATPADIAAARAVARTYLDPERPKVFYSAMFAAPKDDDHKAFLIKTYKQSQNESLKAKIHMYLKWAFGAEAVKGPAFSHTP